MPQFWDTDFANGEWRRKRLKSQSSEKSGAGSKPPGGMEQSEAGRGTAHTRQPVEREKEAHIGGWFRPDQDRRVRPLREVADCEAGDR